MAAKAKKKPVAKKSKTPAKTKAKGGAKPSAKKRATPQAANPSVTLNAKAQARIQPLEDRLIVAAEGPATTTAGGIIIPGNVSERPHRGQVLATGRGRRNKKGQLRPLDVNVGDKVMFAEWAGNKIEVDGRELLILREEDILGIVT